MELKQILKSGLRNKEFYSLMKLCAGRLYKEFVGTKSMSGWVQIKVEKVKANTPGMYYSKDSDGVTIAKALALFDRCSDGAGVTAVFARNHKLSKLPTKSLSLRTVTGLERKSHCKDIVCAKCNHSLLQSM